MAKGRHKAQKRNGIKSRWSEKSTLPNAHATYLRLGQNKEGVSHTYQVARIKDIQRQLTEEQKIARRHELRTRKLTALDLVAPDLRRLARASMHPDNLAQPLPTDSHAYPRQATKLRRKEIEEKPVEYRYLYLRNGEGYKEALVFPIGSKGFWFCRYDNETGSFVSEFPFSDRDEFRAEYDNNVIKVRPVTSRERHFVIARARV